MPINNTKTRALTILKDYVNQMRAAGYSDALIKKKLLENPTITIPEDVSGYGGQTWTGGMGSELLPVTKTPLSRSKETAMGGIPSPDDYMSYKAGQPTTQLPNYAELMGQTQPTGQFGQTKQQNVMNALAEYLSNYQGKTLGYDQGLMEAGVAGMPREYGAQLFQQYKQQTTQKAQERKNVMRNLIAMGASPDELIAASFSIGEPMTMEQAIASAKVGGWQSPEDAQKLENSVNKKLQDFVTSSGQTSYVASLADLIQQGTPLNTMKVEAIKDGLILMDEEWNWLYNKYSPKGITKVGSSFGGAGTTTKTVSPSYPNVPQTYTNQALGQVAAIQKYIKK
jgi:hypothetical protein